MTIAIKSNIVLSALALFLGLAVASPAAWAFADQTDSGTYDIDKEDAELGDYSAWNSRADRKDARSGCDLGWTFGFCRPAGSGKGDARTPADAGPFAPVRPANAPDPQEGKYPERRARRGLNPPRSIGRAVDETLPHVRSPKPGWT